MMPHPAQQKILRAFGHPRAPAHLQLRCGRRFGKSSLSKYAALKVALDFPSWSMLRMGSELLLSDRPMPSTVMIGCPTKVQARDLYWDSLLQDLDGNPLVKKTNSTSLTVTFYGNRPRIKLTGANDKNGEGMRGSEIVAGLFDEFQDWAWDSYEKVCIPAMASVTGSQCIIAGTPKGKARNPMYRIYLLSQSHPQRYHSWHFFTKDNPTIDRLEIANAKATMSAREYREEFEAQFEDFPGRIWEELEVDTLTNVPPLGGQNVMGFDMGDVNPCATVWNVSAMNVWTYLDGWQPKGDRPVTFIEQRNILEELTRQYDTRATVCDPSRPAQILELRELGREKGLEGLINSVEGENSIKEGNTYVHSIIHQNNLKILDLPDHQQLRGVDVFDRFTSYHRKKDRDGNFLDEVAPGQDDHCCDASRYPIYTLGEKYKW
jgi:hypothetical protein